MVRDSGTGPAHDPLERTTPLPSGLPVRVSLDVSAIPAAAAGAGRYVSDLARALAERPDVSLSLISRRHDRDRWAESPGVSVLARAPRRRPSRLAWEQVSLPRLLNHEAVQVHHAPHYTMPERARIPVVVTVHDCTFFDHPEWHERSKVMLFRRAIEVAVRKAAAIVCVSHATATRLTELLEVKVPVVVAHHGVDLERFAPDERSPGDDARALVAFGLRDDQRVVLHVGTHEPRKGVGALVTAFDRLAGTHPDTVLLLAGSPGWGVDQAAAALTGARHANRVRVLGYVADEAIPALMRRAAVVAYPALEEGFGLPALEALACGAPLVTTHGTAMEEIAGPAAWLVAPGDVDELGHALDAVLSDPGGAKVRERRAEGLSIAAGHTWARAAEIHTEVYRRVASR